MRKLIFGITVVLLVIAFTQAVKPAGWEIPTITPTANTVDSTKVKDRSITGGDLINPLRYTGDIGITGTLGIGSGLLPNAKTVLQIRPAVSARDTLLLLKSSAGAMVAYIDSLGMLYVLDVNLNSSADSTDIKNDSIGNEDLVANSVSTIEIRDGTIDSVDVKDNSLSPGDLRADLQSLITYVISDTSLINDLKLWAADDSVLVNNLRIWAESDSILVNNMRLWAETDSIRTNNLANWANIDSALVNSLRLFAEADSVKTNNLRIWAESDSIKINLLRIFAESDSVKINNLRIWAESDSVLVNNLRIWAEADSIRLNTLANWANTDSALVNNLRIFAEADSVKTNNLRIWAESDSANYNIAYSTALLAMLKAAFPDSFNAAVARDVLLQTRAAVPDSFAAGIARDILLQRRAAMDDSMDAWQARTLGTMAVETATDYLTRADTPDSTAAGIARDVTRVKVAGDTMTGDLIIDNTGSDVNSPVLSLRGDDGGVEEEATLHLVQGADPYLRISVDDDNETPVLTGVIDIHDQVVAFVNDNTTDIGATGANRPKDMYMSGAVKEGAWNATAVPTAYGGTGSSTLAAARDSLGLGTMAVEAAASYLTRADTPDSTAAFWARTMVDSTKVTDASLSGGDLVNPLRYGTDAAAKQAIITGQLRVRGATAYGDTLQNWRSSLGRSVAWADSSGQFTMNYITVYENARAGYFISLNNGTPSIVAIGRNLDNDTGIYWLTQYGNRLGIAAKGAAVAIFDSSGVDITGSMDASTAVTAGTYITAGTYATVGTLLNMTPLAAQPDTTGMTGGNIWYTTGDSLYVYKKDHTIGVIFP